NSGTAILGSRIGAPGLGRGATELGSEELAPPSFSVSVHCARLRSCGKPQPTEGLADIAPSLAPCRAISGSLRLRRSSRGRRALPPLNQRSEERRVGKECRYRWSG